MIAASQQVGSVCAPCYAVPDSRLGIITTASVLRSAQAHGCLRFNKARKDDRSHVTFALPRSGSAEEWRVVWDSLDRKPREVLPCRAGCGHADSDHLFSTRTQPHCVDNCRWCTH